MRKWCVFFLILILPAGKAVSFADLSEVGIGARPLALGKAYTAVSSDGSGIFTNPAGLTDYPKLKMVSMTGKLIEDVNYFSVGIAEMFPVGAVGIGYIGASTGSIPLTTLTTTGSGDVISDPYGYTDFSSAVYYLSYSRKIWQNLSLGANLKYLAQNFSTATGSMEGALGSGMEADLGAKWRPQSWLCLAAVVKNILPASSGGKFSWRRNSYEESIPAVLRAGAYLKVLGPAGYRYSKEQNVAVILEAESPVKLQKPSLWHLGCEWWITKGFALRGGIDQDYSAVSGGGWGIENNLALGVGLKAGGFCFDYAYHQYGEIQSNVSHFFSIGFNGYDEEEVAAVKLAPPEPTALKPSVISKPKVKKFSDVGPKYWAKDPIEYFSSIGIMEGYPDDTFRPDLPITRAQMESITRARPSPKSYSLTRAEGVAMIAKFAGLDIPGSIKSGPYSDVDAKAWYAPAVSAAKKAGLLDYIGNKTFQPKKPLTRAETAEILSKTRFGREKIEEFLKGK